MESEKHADTNQACGDCLYYTDNGCLLTGLFKLGESELATDRECDKSKRHLAYKGERGNIGEVVRTESKAIAAGESDSAKAERADENTRDKVACNGRELEDLADAGHKKSCEGADRN